MEKTHLNKNFNKCLCLFLCVVCVLISVFATGCFISYKKYAVNYICVSCSATRIYYLKYLSIYIPQTQKMNGKIIKEQDLYTYEEQYRYKDFYKIGTNNVAMISYGLSNNMPRLTEKSSTLLDYDQELPIKIRIILGDDYGRAYENDNFTATTQFELSDDYVLFYNKKSGTYKETLDFQISVEGVIIDLRMIMKNFNKFEQF